MITRILTYMLYIFIGVNGIWWLICQDGKGFLTTIGFDDKLISVSKWVVNFGVDFIRGVVQS